LGIGKGRYGEGVEGGKDEKESIRAEKHPTHIIPTHRNSLEPMFKNDNASDLIGFPAETLKRSRSSRRGFHCSLTLSYGMVKGTSSILCFTFSIEWIVGGNSLDGMVTWLFAPNTPLLMELGFSETILGY
jgi:hypothetical protein